jgi:hypothetical protein
MGWVPVSAVLGRPNGCRSITTLNVPGSVLCEVTVCSSAVDSERERRCGDGRGGESKWAGRDCLRASSALTSDGSAGGECVTRGVRDP